MFWFRKKSKNNGSRKKVLYIVKNYPQLSQTYVTKEIANVSNDYDLKIISLSSPNLIDPDHHPYETIIERQAILKAVKSFEPDVLHSHYVHLLEMVSDISRHSGVPFTLRSHSVDVLAPLNGQPYDGWEKLPKLINAKNCLGVLCFPFLRQPLIDRGVHAHRLISAPPVVDAQMFHNREANGASILNVGAALPKKKMEDFIALSKQMPEHEFNLFAVGHKRDELRELNDSTDGRVNFVGPVKLSEMPPLYKKHGWLVYTACPQLKTVGRPIAVAEAEAAGVGICMADIRPDLRDYVGESAYLYKDINELPDLLRTKVDPARREAGFEHALSMDIRLHIGKLTDLWDSAS